MEHSFHFKINSKENNQLNELAHDLSIKKKSKLILYLITTGIKQIDFIMKSLNNQFSKKSDRDNRNKDLRIKLTEPNYRFFKSWHSYYNTFSIAMIVRAFIHLFFNGIKKFGTIEKFLDFLKKTKKVLKNEIFKNMFKKIHINKILIICEEIIIKFILLLSIHLNC